MRGCVCARVYVCVCVRVHAQARARVCCCVSPPRYGLTLPAGCHISSSGKIPLKSLSIKEACRQSTCKLDTHDHQKLCNGEIRRSTAQGQSTPPITYGHEHTQNNGVCVQPYVKYNDRACPMRLKQESVSSHQSAHEHTLHVRGTTNGVCPTICQIK